MVLKYDDVQDWSLLGRRGAVQQCLRFRTRPHSMVKTFKFHVFSQIKQRLKRMASSLRARVRSAVVYFHRWHVFIATGCYSSTGGGHLGRLVNQLFLQIICSNSGSCPVTILIWTQQICQPDGINVRESFVLGLRLFSKHLRTVRNFGVFIISIITFNLLDSAKVML